MRKQVPRLVIPEQEDSITSKEVNIKNKGFMFICPAKLFTKIMCDTSHINNLQSSLSQRNLNITK